MTLGRIPRLVALASLVCVMLLGGCQSASSSASSSSASSDSPTSWVRLASRRVPVKYVADVVGPLRLQTGHIRIVVRISGDLGKGFGMQGQRRGGAEAVDGPDHPMWEFNTLGIHRVRANLRPGVWSFVIGKGSFHQVALVTIFERR